MERLESRREVRLAQIASKKGRPGAARAPDLFLEYLKRRPPKDPATLLTRSALALLRCGFLARGVFREHWSVGWLAAFLFAEFFLIARLTIVGDRWGGGPPLDAKARKGGSAPRELVLGVVALALAAGAGIGLDRSTGGGWFGSAGSFGVDLSRLGAGMLTGRLPWGPFAYLALLLIEFARDVAAARSGRRPFVSVAAVHAAFFGAAAILSVFLFFALMFLGSWAGDDFIRAAIAVCLLLSRTLSELAAIWLPVWGRWVPGFSVESKESARGPSSPAGG
jgi:hypothetical protein